MTTLNRLTSPAQWLRHIAAPLLLAASVITLVACGGGGYLPSPNAVTDQRPLPAAFTQRKAAAYSPYRDARSEAELDAEVITPERVLQDLRLVQAADVGVIRLFSSARFGETVLSVIRSNGLDLKVQLGAYVYNPSTDAVEAQNQAELASAIALANRYSDIVLAVSVGNEAMVDFSFLNIPPATMARYLKQVRAAIRQPITTNDNWYFWVSAPNVVLEVVDFAAVHTYPLLDTFYSPNTWDWRQRDVPAAQRAAAMMDAAVQSAKNEVGAVRTYLDRIGLPNMPIVIGETGWTAIDYNGDPALGYRASPVNQKMYYDRLQAWLAEPTGNRPPAQIFYFQSFDEQWKSSDDGWGLFTRDRKARCVVQALNPPSASWVYDSSVSCDPSTAVYFDPPVPAEPLDPGVSRLVLFSDAPVLAGDLVAGGRSFNPFAGTTAPLTGATFAPDGGSQSIEISPNPANFGWGFFQVGPALNLSGFAQGNVNLWIRTNGYPGKIEIGVWTDTDDRNQAEAYVQIENGQYGYCTNDTWCQVTIPVSAFLAANPALDLRLVTAGFVISDVFDRTGKPLNTTGLPKVYVDGITWTR
jgi:exo-beta-1,3-glucanase (GH17 family)